MSKHLPFQPLSSAWTLHIFPPRFGVLAVAQCHSSVQGRGNLWWPGTNKMALLKAEWVKGFSADRTANTIWQPTASNWPLGICRALLWSFPLFGRWWLCENAVQWSGPLYARSPAGDRMFSGTSGRSLLRRLWLGSHSPCVTQAQAAPSWPPGHPGDPPQCGSGCFSRCPGGSGRSPCATLWYG